MPDSLNEVLDWFDKQWHSALGSVHDVPWEDLPEKAYEEILVLLDRVSQHGTLPLFRMPDQASVHIQPESPRTRSTSIILRQPRQIVRRHPWVCAAILTGAIGAYCYWRPPSFFARVPLLNQIVPVRTIPLHPRRLADGTRLDAVLVLGAERGGLGREIATDLERRGFVVLATVPDAGEVEALERLGRGHIKALVLDPSDAGNVPPLLRSLSTSLSLRFPLNTPDDPFRAAHQSPSLCAVVNCLALATHCSTSHSAALLGPLEATPMQALTELLQKRVVTSLGVLQGTLPLLRSAPGRASMVTLVPASTARVALPYVGAQSLADSALAALNDVLRRELTDSKISVSTLDVGFFERTHHGSARQHIGLGVPAIDLPPHLRAVYQPRGGNQPSSRQRSDVRKLSSKVYRTIMSPSSGRHGVGAGSKTYSLASVLPSRALDAVLNLQQRLSPATPAITVTGEASDKATAGRKPLPTPPSGHSSSMDSSYVRIKAQGSSESESEGVIGSTAEMAR